MLDLGSPRLRVFPVLVPSDYRLRLAQGEDLPEPITSVPLGFVAPHERQALRNHYQSLDKLADRGGLAPNELLAVVEDRSWTPVPTEDAIRELRAHLLQRGF